MTKITADLEFHEQKFSFGLPIDPLLLELFAEGNAFVKKMYVEKGYEPSATTPMPLEPEADCVEYLIPDGVIAGFYVKNKETQGVVAHMLAHDANKILPIEDDFPVELATIRDSAAGRKIIYFGSLCIIPELAASIQVIKLLTWKALVFSLNNHAHSGLIVVNPENQEVNDNRHEKYYREMFGFVPIKKLPRLRSLNKPAVLMTVNESTLRKEAMNRIFDRNKQFLM